MLISKPPLFRGLHVPPAIRLSRMCLAAANGGRNKLAEWSRPFLVPGMAHCAAGRLSTI